MLVEYVEIKRKRGVGDVVLLALLLLTSIVALIRLLLRGETQLRNVPVVRLFGRIPFGSAMLWGVVIFVVGLLFLLTFLSIEEKDASDWWMLWLMVVPNLLTGFFLLCFAVSYNSYRAAADELLVKIAQRGELCPADMNCTVNGVKFKSEQMVRILEDLREHGAVGYKDCGNGCFRAHLVGSNLIAHAAMLLLTPQAEPSAEPGQKMTSWTCVSCGAPNTTFKGEVCAYCGAEPKQPGTR